MDAVAAAAAAAEEPVVDTIAGGAVGTAAAAPESAGLQRAAAAAAVMDALRTHQRRLVEAKRRASDQFRGTFRAPPPRGPRARPIWPGSVAWSSMDHQSRFSLVYDTGKFADETPSLSLEFFFLSYLTTKYKKSNLQNLPARVPKFTSRHRNIP